MDMQDQRYLSLLKSDDIEMKNLGLTILLSLSSSTIEIDKTLKECIKHPFHIDYGLDFLAGQREISIYRSSLGKGIYEQLKDRHVHVYGSKEISLQLLQNMFKTINSNDTEKETNTEHPQ